MALTQSQTDICNLALMRLGQRKIQAITDQTDGNAIACNVGWNQALGEVSRETPWNCLMTRAILPQLALPAWDTSCSASGVPANPPAWVPHTNYAVNAFITYANQIYQCLIANTSSSSFTIDLTQGYWFETTFISTNYLGPYPFGGTSGCEWQFAYGVPTDLILLVELNGLSCWGWGSRTTGDLYELYQNVLMTNAPCANVKYNRFETDTTKYDTLFTGALVLNLAAIIATTVRKDDANLSMRMRQEYEQYVTRARVKNAGERNPIRYNIATQSRFVRSRRRGTNG